MIALVILGLGLLFIAAALPVGLEYTRQTVDQSNAEAAGQYALNQLELNLRTSRWLYQRDLFGAAGVTHRLDNIHRPRDTIMQLNPPPPISRYPLRETYEPVIKVRPLALGNIGMSGVVSGDPQRGAEIADNGELAISLYLNSVWGLNIPDITIVRREYEFPYDGSSSLDDLLSLVNNPVLPGLARVYPAVEPVTAFTVGAFFDPSDDDYPTYDARFRNPPQGDAATLHRERQKAVEHRVAWTGFYRRISYRGTPGPDPVWFNANDVADNPLLYELIVVVTRRTSVNHRYPRQDLSAGTLATFETPTAVIPAANGDPAGADRLAPTPWLVTFDSTPTGGPWVSPQLMPTTDYMVLGTGPNFERVLMSGFTDPPTLTFRCTPELGALLPVGSMFIPAVNDQRYVPPPQGIAQQVGFVPSAPETLPIYEVVERPDETTVVVKNNGYYPWLNTGLDASAWPVWVILPAFVERDSNGQPVYERKSPILQVVRRTVMLHEMTP